MAVVNQAKDISAIYREVTSYPAVTDASVSQCDSGSRVLVTSTWSQRDLDRKEKCSYVRTHTLDTGTGEVLSHTGPQEVNSQIWNRVSPSGKLRAVVRKGKDKKNEDKQYLEIFDGLRKLKTIDVLALEKHGKIIANDGQFGSLEWSSSEGHLLYIAEKKKPKTAGFFEAKAFLDDGDGDGAEKKDEVQRGSEFEYRESWGEQLVECREPVPCVMDVEHGTVTVLGGWPEGMSAGQALWSPDDAGVLCCGWPQEPYRLGLKFCSQRKSYLYYLDIQKGTVEVLSEEGRAVRHPSLSPDAASLVYLDCAVGGPHNQCARLVKIDWATRSRTVVVEQVDCAPAPEFPGIFLYGVARNAWFPDSEHLAMDTQWRSTGAVIIVNTKTKEVKRLEKDKDPGSMSLLCVHHNTVVLACSSLVQPFHLALACLKSPESLSDIRWVLPDGPPVTLDWCQWEVMTHTPTGARVHPQYGSLDYESILCLPNNVPKGELPPLILFSHGGPNSAFSTSFNIIASLFCRCGFAVVLVNYRGSVGFGQHSLQSLQGNIGTQDVRDCESAMVEVVAGGRVDGNRLFAFGGSHGGFLTTHLIGQYPDTFKGAATRNPVTNLVSMFSQTDINDWIFAQAGIEFDYDSLCDDKAYAKLWKASPMCHINQVKTPLLLMIGQEDKRVPPSQGLEYWRGLRARGRPVRYLTYPGNNHSISDVDAEADCMVNTVLWFAERC